jgi:hypothetical protein
VPGEERLADRERLQALPLRPIAKPTLSPMIAAAAAITISTTMLIFPSWASSAAVISAVSPGTGTPIVSIAISAKTSE